VVREHGERVVPALGVMLEGTSRAVAGDRGRRNGTGQGVAAEAHGWGLAPAGRRRTCVEAGRRWGREHCAPARDCAAEGT
jgi:hypothetical protein